MPYVGKEPVRGQNRELDDISGSFNGGNTAFTMQVGGINTAAGSANQVFISLGGVMQNPGTDFTVASSTLTFTTPPANGLDFWGLIQGDAVDINTPADGSVTSSKIASGNLTLPGDVTIPDKIVHDGDTNTAIRFPAADTITAETGGSERLRIDSSKVEVSGTALNLIGTGATFLEVGSSNASGSYLILDGDSNGDGDGGDYSYIAHDTSGDLQYVVDNPAGTGNHIFKTGGSAEKLRIQTAGGISFNGDTAAANALDDYEEGTAVMQIGATGGSAPSTQCDSNNCVYTKIGNQVTVRVTWDSKNLAGIGGNIQLQSLPFTVSNTGGHFVLPVEMTQNIAWSGNEKHCFYTSANTTTANGLSSRDNLTWVNWASSDWDNSTSISLYMSFTYLTT